MRELKRDVRVETAEVTSDEVVVVVEVVEVEVLPLLSFEKRLLAA